MSLATADALTYTYDTTDVDVVLTQPYRVNTWTDLYYVYDASLPGDVVGRYECLTPTGSSSWRCDHARILYNPDLLPQGDYALQRYIACHETGHSLGLIHGDDSQEGYAPDDPSLGCMRTPLQTDSYYLGAHNAAHLNNHY